MKKSQTLQFVRNIFITIEETPNPETMKFIPCPETSILPKEFGNTYVQMLLWIDWYTIECHRQEISQKNTSWNEDL